MIKVNTKTLQATREAIPAFLIGLSQHTLQNLQAELNPIPAGLVNIEYWQEVDKSPALTETQVYDGTETLTADHVTKTVSVVRGVREKTVEELTAERKALVPTSVTPRQARIALLRANMLDAINAAVSSNAEWAIAWEFATSVERTNPIIEAVALQLGKTEEDIDQLFIDASKL